MSQGLKKFRGIILTIIKYYFIGATTFFFSGALVQILTKIGNWTLSLPIWGLVFAFVILEYAVIRLFEKHLSSK